MATRHCGRPAGSASRPTANAAARWKSTIYRRARPILAGPVAPAIMIDHVSRLPELMDKLYAPQEIERRIYERWEKSGWFAPRGSGEPYCIVIPPPNVTGTLHLGHAFQHTLMDTLTRYQRMRGADTLWQSGTDHAGIATQMVVERRLEAAGEHRSRLTREQFVARVWEWKEQSGGTICAQMRRLGDSVDWARDRFTMDAGLSQAVIEAFVRLHAEGLIYRGSAWSTGTRCC